MTSKGARVQLGLEDMKRARGGVGVQTGLRAGLTVKQKVVENAVGEMRDYEK
jgi:hypothetical protein